MGRRKVEWEGVELKRGWDWEERVGLREGVGERGLLRKVGGRGRLDSTKRYAGTGGAASQVSGGVGGVKVPEASEREVQLRSLASCVC